MAFCRVGRSTGWCALCYSGIRRRRAYRGHAGYRAPRVVRYYPWELDPMKRPDAAAGPGGPAPETDPRFVKDYPTLWAYLTDEKWEDGKARERATLTVVVEGGLFRGSVNDRALKRSFWRSGESVKALLDSFEKALAGPGPDWRAFKGR